MDKIVFAMLALFGFSAMGQLPNKALAVKEIAVGERATAFVFPYPTCRRARFTLEPRAGSTVESAHVLVDGRSYRLEKVEGVFSALVDMPGKDGESRVDFEIKTANGIERFDGNVEPHVHFVCTQCQAITDLPQIAVPEQLRSSVEQATGGIVGECQLSFTGICQSCCKSEKTA